jgi:Tol biopolymer transport system component
MAAAALTPGEVQTFFEDEYRATLKDSGIEEMHYPEHPAPDVGGNQFKNASELRKPILFANTKVRFVSPELTDENMASRLTPEPTWSLAPAWSPDGARIVYGASREGASDLFVRPADGVGAETRLYVSRELKVPTDWTRDGRIVFNTTAETGTDIATLKERGAGEPSVLVGAKANEGSGTVSPDGRWLGYTSNESGRVEVYVPALGGRGRWPVSRSGGWQPRWRRDGKELFFVNGEATLMAARVTASGSEFTAAEPEALPIKVQPDVTGWRYSYDVLSLGQRFIANVPSGRDGNPPIVAIPGWTALLPK